MRVAVEQVERQRPDLAAARQALARGGEAVGALLELAERDGAGQRLARACNRGEAPTAAPLDQRLCA